jgi:chromosome segregation ATPase
MLRDLFIGSVLGIAVYLWRTRATAGPAGLESSANEPKLTREPEDPQLQSLQQKLTQTQQSLAIALEKCAEAETQIAELNQLATDRAIELIQLQADNADLSTKVAELTQKRSRKKRTPKPKEALLESINLIAKEQIDLPEIAPFTLDLTRIESKQTESAAATQLLESVFVEESASGEPHGSWAGLDAAHSHFVQILSQQPHWSRAALAQIAQQQSLLLDGALEVINEAAFEQCDEALTEGEDPIQVNSAVLQELLS